MRSISNANSKEEVFTIFDQLKNFNEGGINGNLFIIN
jgi:hypothetical protein